MLKTELLPGAHHSSIATNSSIFGKVFGYGHFIIVQSKWFVSIEIILLEGKKEPHFKSFAFCSGAANKSDSVDYRSIFVQNKPTLVNTIENGKHLEMLHTVFRRFNDICGSYLVSAISIETISYFVLIESMFHINRLKMMPVSAISFIRLPMSRNIGLYVGHTMMNWPMHLRTKFRIIRLECYFSMAFITFEHQTKCKRMRSKRLHFIEPVFQNLFLFLLFFSNWSVSPSGKLQRIADPRGNVKPYLTKFSELAERLVKNGNYDVETAYNRSKLPHLITWFQTDEAMVMLLSNHTVQVS